MINLFLFLVFLGVFIATGYFANWWLDPNRKQDPADKNQQRFLHAQNALDKSHVYLVQIGKELECSRADVAQLTGKVTAAVKEGKDEDARRLIKRLQAEEIEFKQLEVEYSNAGARHASYAEAVETERQKIASSKREAESLAVRLQLAEAERAYQSTKSPESLEKMRQAVRLAEITNAKPVNEEDEFLQAGEAEEIEQRLADFKKQV